MENEKEDDLGRTMRGDDIKAEHLENICNETVKEIEHIKKLALIMENSPHRPNAVEDARKFRENFGKLIHRFNVTLKCAMMFGINDTEGAINVIDTNKLPSLEQAKRMSKEELEKALDDATKKDPMFKL